MDLSRVQWRKSTHSGAETHCVEVAGIGAMIAVRDSKDPDGPKLTVTPTDWRALLIALKIPA